MICVYNIRFFFRKNISFLSLKCHFFKEFEKVFRHEIVFKICQIKVIVESGHTQKCLHGKKSRKGNFPEMQREGEFLQ